jgi:hypothetical protein
MEHYQLANHIDLSLKQQKQSKTDKDESKTLSEKPNDNKCKAKPKKNNSDMQAAKKPCILHGPNSSHMTDECQTLQEQTG